VTLARCKNDRSLFRTIMSQETIGYTTCQACGGTGKNPDETACTNCGGTGWIVVFKKSTVVATPPVQSSGRRRFPRYYTDLGITLRNQQEQKFSGRCVVIAESGLGAILPHPFPAGTVVTLQVSIPNYESALNAQAVVRNQEGLRHGFEFVSLADSERAAIRQFCGGLMLQSDDERKKS